MMKHQSVFLVIAFAGVCECSLFYLLKLELKLSETFNFQGFAAPALKCKSVAEEMPVVPSFEEQGPPANYYQGGPAAEGPPANYYQGGPAAEGPALWDPMGNDPASPTDQDMPAWVPTYQRE
jgi:hypothetical protein